MRDNFPLVAVTMGDPGGIGPELVLRVLVDTEGPPSARYVILGDPEVARVAAAVVGVSPDIREVAAVEEVPADADPQTLFFLCPEGARVGAPVWGSLDIRYGCYAALCIAEAFQTRHGFSALVCAPMNKEAFHQAGFDFSDELAYMADITGAKHPAIMGVMDGIWTATMSEHVPFSEIRSHVRRDRIVDKVKVLNQMLRRVGRARPRIAVAALNPHAGEGGLFGREEIDEIGPAVEDARGLGIAVEGPVPADMVFVLATDGRYDGVLAMYHDQANIARKLHARGRGCTVFHGLPIPGTTTAHGTAFDIAGSGKANPGSFRDALEVGVALAASGVGS